MQTIKDLFEEILSEIEKKYIITIKRRKAFKEEGVEFERGSLEKLHTHELRNLARDVGVRAPTTKPNRELIEEVIAIKVGKKNPAPKNTRGRPVKK